MEQLKVSQKKNKFKLENIGSSTELEIIEKLVETNKINLNDPLTLSYLLSLTIKPKKTSTNNINLLLYLYKFFSKRNENIFKEFAFQASELGKEKILKIILENNFNINSQNELGETLLHVAIAKSDIKLINLLLKYSPNKDIKTYNDNLTVFDYALTQENSSIISLLEKNEINVRNNLYTIYFNDRHNKIIGQFPSKKNDIKVEEDSNNILNSIKSRNNQNNYNGIQNELLYFDTKSEQEEIPEQMDSIEIKLINKVKTKEEELKKEFVNKEENENSDEENEEIFNELTGNIEQRISNFSSFEDNLSLFHQKFSIIGLKDKENNLNSRRSAKTNVIENNPFNKIINNNNNKHYKIKSKQLTRDLSTNIPSLLIPLKNENENEFLTEQTLIYNNAYNFQKREKKNIIEFNNFFNEIGLSTEYMKILSLNGFDDLNLLIEQTKNGIAITDENLREIGIKLPGIRAKILIHLEELSNLFDFPIEREKVYFENERNKNCLYRLLSSINLEYYLKNFIDNGYSSPELLFIQMQSKQPLTEEILFKEIGIDKIGYRMSILNKIKNEGCNYLYKLKNGFLGKNKFGDNKTVIFERKNEDNNNNNEFCNMCSII
jgi:hypothetical protein